MARPIEYKEEYIQKVDEYLVLCKDEIEDYHKTRGEKSDSYNRIVNVKLPKIEGFAEYIDVNKTSLYAWEKLHPIFSNALDKIRVAQHNRLIDNGLSGNYNPVIAKLVLSSNHGYKEKSDLTSDGKQLPTPIYGSLSTNHSDKTDISAQE